MEIKNTSFHKKLSFMFHSLLRMFHSLLRMFHRFFVFINLRIFDRWLLPHAACVLIENKNGQILAVSRKNDSTKFGLVGGKVDLGERNILAAIREVKEETGIRLNWFDLQKVFEGSDDTGYWVTCYRYYPLYIDEYLIINPDVSETGIVKWVNRQELLNGPFSNYNRKVFEAIDK